MHRLVHFFVFSYYILISFALANDDVTVERPLSLQDQCMQLNILDLEEYISTLKLTNVPTIDSMVFGFKLPMTTLPFGILRSDWTRLLLLRDAQEKDSILIEKLELLFKLLIIAYQRFEQSLVPKKSFNGINNSVNRNIMETKFTNMNYSSEIVKTKTYFNNTNFNIIAYNRGDINENENNESKEKEKNVKYNMEYNINSKGNEIMNDPIDNYDKSKAASFMNLQGITKANCLENTIKSSYTERVNKLLTNTRTLNDQNNDITNVRIRNELINEKGITIPLLISIIINSESANVIVPTSTKKIVSLDNSTNTIKSDYAETSTEEFNSIDCSLSTVRNEISEEIVSQKKQTKINSNNIIHLNNFDEISNRNIQENRDTNLTNSNDVTFSNVIEKSKKQNVLLQAIKNDDIKIHNITNINEINKNENNFDFSTSNNFHFNITSVDSEKFSTPKILDSTKSIEEKNFREIDVNNLINYKNNIRTTTSKILSILKNDNSKLPSNVRTTNSMDHYDPSAYSIYDVFTQKTVSFIDRFHHKVGDKLNKLPVFLEQLPGHVTKDHKANVEVSSLGSKTITFLTNKIPEINRYKERFSNSLKHNRIVNIDTNIERNFRLFYNYGGRRPLEKIRENNKDVLDFIRIKCQNEIEKQS